jgi:rubredoxin
MAGGNLQILLRVATDLEVPDALANSIQKKDSNVSNETEVYQTWMCLICGWVYDEAAGAPEDGIAPGTRWADVPMNWTCPECGARKDDFEMTAI